MQLDCELVANGLSLPAGYDDPRAQALEATAADWRLLLQLDNDDELNVGWGDAGRLYFWIRRQDLARCNFDHTWTLWQTH